MSEVNGEDKPITIRKREDGMFSINVPNTWNLMELLFAHRLLQAEIDQRFDEAQRPRVQPVTNLPLVQ